MWTATMPLWIALVIIVLLVLLAIIGFAGWWHNADKDHTAYWNMEKERDKLNTENEQLHKAIGEQAKAYAQLIAQNESLDEDNACMAQQNADFAAQNADLREALQEKIVEIKALQMNTVEVPEVAPEPVKRTRKKAGQGNG